MPTDQAALATQLHEAVNRGAEWLDRVWPSWPEEVDPDLLNMSDGCNCILGQLGKTVGAGLDESISFGEFLKCHMGDGVKIHGLPPEDDELAMTAVEAVERGFSIPLVWGPRDHRRAMWRTLTDQWQVKLAMRGRVGADPEPEGPDPDFARKYAIENPEADMTWRTRS